MLFGIDFGTMECCIAALDSNGNPKIIRNEIDGKDTLAAAVYFEDENNVIIGENARDMVEIDGERVAQFVKRYLGKEDAPNWVVDGKEYTAVEISSLILMRLKQMAEEQGYDVDNVVIAVPSYFGLGERAAIRHAGELAGMNVIAMISEPVAAILSYCAEQPRTDQTILLCDLGGTFDSSIVRMSVKPDENGEMIKSLRFLASNGDSRLGGSDWSEALYEYVLDRCCEEHGLLPDEMDDDTRSLLRMCADSGKKRLSGRDVTKMRIAVKGVMDKIVVTREEFEEMTAHLVDRTMACVETVLSEYDGPIDQVVLTGGCARMPMIQRALETRFPGKVTLHCPDTAVARGAVLYAATLV